VACRPCPNYKPQIPQAFYFSPKSRKYKFGNPEGLYFVSFATVYWIDIFVREEYCNIILDSLAHCRHQKGLELYCWRIMASCVHLIFRAKEQNPSELLGRFKEHTSKAIKRAIADNATESRREWILWMMERAASKNSSVSNYQFWQHHNKPIELWSHEVIEHKADYIHRNPVTAGCVEVQIHWRYSSAIDYSGSKGLIDIDLLWEV
jgi:putative transposase